MRKRKKVREKMEEEDGIENEIKIELRKVKKVFVFFFKQKTAYEMIW